MDIHVDSLHSDPFAFNRDSHHHHHLPLPDFSSDDSPPPFSDALSPKHSLKDLDELHPKSVFQSQHNNELLDDFIGGPSSPSPVGSPTIKESEEPHNIPDLTHSSGSGDAPLFTPITIPIALPPGGTTVIDGVTYNNRGYEVCGALNKFNKPCQRIGRCPFHPDHKKTDTTTTTPTEGGSGSSGGGPAPTPEPRRFLPIKKGPYKSGWKKDEHLRFLKGLQIHGKGSWKDIALIVGTRTPTQIQVHAHRYYLRQQQGTKNKRSIHDISLEDLEELEVQHGSIMPGPQSPSVDDGSTEIHMFPPSTYNNTNSNHTSSNNNIHSPPSPPIIHSPIHSNSPPFSVSNTNSTNFPPLFSSSSNSTALPGLLPLPLPLPGNTAPFPMNFHSSPSWFHFNSIPSMGNMGDDNLAALHLPPPSDHKYSFSHEDYEDDEDIADFTPNHVPHLHDTDDDS